MSIKVKRFMLASRVPSYFPWDAYVTCITVRPVFKFPNEVDLYPAVLHDSLAPLHFGDKNYSNCTT